MSQVKEILKHNVRYIIFSLSAFAVGIPLGVIAYPLFEEQLPALLAGVFADVISGSTTQIIVKVFLRNISASLIMLALGLTIVLTVAALFINGFIVGLVARYSIDKGLNLSQIILGILPHGVFELPAIFTSTAVGIHIGVKALTSKGRRVQAVSQAIREASLVYLTVVVPLLAAAAVIEVVVSKNLIGG
jgi:stage II sporulation protein M